MDRVESAAYSDPSVTSWISELRQGDSAAAKRLWGFLHRQLMHLAQRELADAGPMGFDAEDVALSAFATFCETVQQGRYRQIANRGEVWQLMTVITLNKARRRKRDERRLRRGGGLTRQDEEVLREITSPCPAPDMVTLVQEECERLLGRLERRDLQLVALLKVEGYTNEEVAQRMGCTRRTVHRRLALIRKIWAEEFE